MKKAVITWVPRDGLNIKDINGKMRVGAPPRARKRMEVKYTLGDNGQYEAAAMRYVAEDYVPGQEPAPTATAQTAQAVTPAQSQPGETFTGTIELVQAVRHRIITHPFKKITVVDANGQKNIFFVFGTTPVFDTTGKELNEGGDKVGAFFLKKGQRVEVKWSIITDGNIITNGQKGTDSVRILE